MNEVEVVDQLQLQAILDKLPPLLPGSECYTCHRPVPKIASDEKHGAKRSVVSIPEPRGEEGTLNALMVAVTDKYQVQWPRDYAAMRGGIGLEVIGGRGWRYHVTHFALYATLMVPGLEPDEGDVDG